VFRLARHSLDGVLAENQYFNIGHRFLDLRSGTQAIHLGHANVHDHYIRPQILSLRDGFNSIASRADYAPIVMSIKQALKRRANGLFVIDHENS
jgi:hypothetical protein